MQHSWLLPAGMAAPEQAKRIVSLVPSLTEWLHTLGLEEETVGITKFCIRPDEWFRQKTRVGGTKNVHVDELLALQPDLVIASKEENVAEQVQAIAQQVPVLLTDIENLEDALASMQLIADIAHRSEVANTLLAQIQMDFATALPQAGRALYLIWREPYMSVGGDTFIHAMLQMAGWENVCGHQTRYPTFTLAEMQALQPDVLLLSSEPFPFKINHVLELSAHFPHTRICLVDGEMFSWYGSRLLKSMSYFKELHRQLT